MQKIIFIINPKAGTDRIKNITQEINAVFSNTGISFEIIYTAYKGHGFKIAEQAAKDGITTVIAVGGDGSVNEIASALINQSTHLGIIPLGSGNGIARSLHIPINIKAAIDKIRQQKTTKIDCGCINNTQYFFSNFGLGFDATVAKIFARSERRGLITYAAIVAKLLWTYKAPTFNIEIDGIKSNEKGFMINIANAAQFGYNFKIAPNASLQDGLLDIVIIKPFPIITSYMIAARGFLGNLYKSKFVKHIQAKKIIIEGTQHHFQIDGDYFDTNENEFEIKIIPQSLNIIV